MLLAEAIQEARREVDAEIELAVAERAERRKQALQLVAYKLTKLALNIHSSRRILNDLRTLRRLLLAERQGVEAAGVVGAEAWSAEDAGVAGD